MGPTGVCPTGVCPTGVGPTGVCPTGVCPTGVGPTGSSWNTAIDKRNAMIITIFAPHHNLAVCIE